MEVMTLNEAIQHCEEIADFCEDEASKYDLTDDFESYMACKDGKCAAEHRQLARWLKDYKRLLEQQSREPHKGNIYLSREAYGDLCFAASKWNELEICGGNSEYVRRGKTGEWIPVSERLPKDSQLVLMTIRRMGEHWNHEPFISVGYISWNQTAWWCAHDGDCKSHDVRVDAWMPLPEPYKSERKE